MPIEITYTLKCDVCPNVKVDGPWDMAIDYISLSVPQRIQLGSWLVVDYRVVCPKHKITIFKGYGHGKKKKKIEPTGDLFGTKPRDSL